MFSGLWRGDRPQVRLLGVSVGEEESELKLMNIAFVHPRMGVKAMVSPWRRGQEGSFLLECFSHSGGLYLHDLIISLKAPSPNTIALGV